MWFAVLTGDIVNSSDLDSDELDEVIEAVDTAARALSGWGHAGSDRTETAFSRRKSFARRGGDGWQVALDQPRYALRAALFIRANMRVAHDSAQTRIAAAVGTGTLPDSMDDDLNSAHGPVFSASGRLLEDLGGRTLMSFAADGATRAAFVLADHISQGWTEAQARSLCVMLPPGAGPRRFAAEKLGISRQAVDQALHAAGFPALEAALDALESQADPLASNERKP